MAHRAVPGRTCRQRGPAPPAPAGAVWPATTRGPRRTGPATGWCPAAAAGAWGAATFAPPASAPLTCGCSACTVSMVLVPTARHDYYQQFCRVRSRCTLSGRVLMKQIERACLTCQQQQNLRSLEQPAVHTCRCALQLQMTQSPEQRTAVLEAQHSKARPSGFLAPAALGG